MAIKTALRKKKKKKEKEKIIQEDTVVVMFLHFNEKKQDRDFA